jgi:tetratricopeptide (TPR) repeat protein
VREGISRTQNTVRWLLGGVKIDAYVFVDMGNKLNDDAAYLNAKDYAKAKIEIDNAFRKALPYFEKAYEMAPDNLEYKRSLRQLYYRLGEEEKYYQLAD